MSREERIKAFLTSPTDVFETIEHRHEIWREDPFDVPSIHSAALFRFRELLGAATAPGGAPGRVLLLLLKMFIVTYLGVVGAMHAAPAVRVGYSWASNNLRLI